ncbi:hypothetical protein R1sor_019666 [Riccia sorocarpa]|uniref:Uncharacterized protein n=1 Tax=Riccia sorocarpa TaxID=122646 RepID=A0ABD3IJE7_9MARC
MGKKAPRVPRGGRPAGEEDVVSQIGSSPFYRVSSPSRVSMNHMKKDNAAPPTSTTWHFKILAKKKTAQSGSSKMNLKMSRYIQLGAKFRIMSRSLHQTAPGGQTRAVHQIVPAAVTPQFWLDRASFTSKFS